MIAIIAILASLLLPSITNAKHKANNVYCMNNHRQLMLAWRMYADDNADRLAFAGDIIGDGSLPASGTWVGGNLDFSPSNPSNWDVNQDVKKSPLFPYCAGNTRIWRCPSDRSRVKPSSGPFAGQIVPRVRSMTMNIFMGGNAGDLRGLPELDGWVINLKFGDMTYPGPSKSFVLLDHREDSINTGTFGTWMNGYPDNPGDAHFMQDYPASYHLKAGGLSFADGHSEIHRWLDPRTTFAVTPGVHLTYGFVPSPNNVDIIWLQERATRRK